MALGVKDGTAVGVEVGTDEGTEVGEMDGAAVGKHIILGAEGVDRNPGLSASGPASQG